MFSDFNVDTLHKVEMLYIFFNKLYYYGNNETATDGCVCVFILVDGEKRQHTQRTIALAVGGVAVLGFVIVCLLVLKSAMKKKSKYDSY